MRRSRWAAAAALLTVLLPSCASGEPDASETATPAPTTAAEINAAELMAAISSAQREAGTYQMEISNDFEGLEFDATGAVRYPDSGQAPDLSLTMNLPPEQGGEIAMVLIDGSAYLRPPPDTGLPTPWLKIQPDGSDPISAQMAPLIEQMTSSADFEQYSEAFGSATSIDQVGTNLIDGVDVTEYLVTVDVSEMPADALGGVAPEDLPFDAVTQSMWVDEDNVVRRITSDLGGYGTMDTRYFAYGEPVEIEAPPWDQVTDLSTLFEGLSEEELAELFPSP
jgi:hypothetical protein